MDIYVKVQNKVANSITKERTANGIILAFKEWKAVYVAGYIINNVQRTHTITK